MFYQLNHLLLFDYADEFHHLYYYDFIDLIVLNNIGVPSNFMKVIGNRY